MIYRLGLVLLWVTCASALQLPGPAFARTHVRGATPVMAYNPVKAPSAEEAAKKNPTGLKKSAKFAGVKANDRATKKNTRNKIMKKKTYKRGGNPFDRSVRCCCRRRLCRCRCC